VRDIISIQSVKYRTLEPGFGYVRISSFQSSTAGDLRKALDHLETENKPMLGLILDLRNDPGGLLEQAVEVSDEFLDEGLIVYTGGRLESQKMRFEARRNNKPRSYPIVALVNSGSASGAIIIGQRTFGKASVQTILPMDDGSALRLTTARYYTPNGRSIQAKGIEPDIVVSDGREETGTFPGPMREKDIERHLKGEGEEEPAAAPVQGAPKKEEKVRPKAAPPADQEARKEDAKDPQLDRAVELLKGWEIFKNRYIDRKKAS